MKGNKHLKSYNSLGRTSSAERKAKQIERSQRPVRNKLLIIWNPEVVTFGNHRQGFKVRNEQKARKIIASRKVTNMKSATYYDSIGKAFNVLTPLVSESVN